MDEVEQTDELVFSYKLPINLWGICLIISYLIFFWLNGTIMFTNDISWLKIGALSKINWTWWKTKETIKCFCFHLYLGYNKILSTQVLLYESAIGLDPRSDI